MDMKDTFIPFNFYGYTSLQYTIYVDFPEIWISMI